MYVKGYRTKMDLGYTQTLSDSNHHSLITKIINNKLICAWLFDNFDYINTNSLR
jgi:hypothetical protein